MPDSGRFPVGLPHLNGGSVDCPPVTSARSLTGVVGGLPVWYLRALRREASAAATSPGEGGKGIGSSIALGVLLSRMVRKIARSSEAE